MQTIQYNTIQYNTIQYNTIQCNAMQCNAMQCNAMQCNAMQCNAMQCNAMQCNAMQCNAIQYNTIQYNTILQTSMPSNPSRNSSLFSQLPNGYQNYIYDFDISKSIAIPSITCTRSRSDIVNFSNHSMTFRRQHWTYICNIN